MTQRIVVIVALAVLFAAPGTATAEHFTKQAIDMQSVLVPLRQVSAPKQDTQSDPIMTIDEFLERTQARIHTINRKQISYVRDLIQLAAPDDPQLPDYYFRLGELFAEQYRILNNLARGLDEPIFRAGRESIPKSPATVHRGIQ